MDYSFGAVEASASTLKRVPFSRSGMFVVYRSIPVQRTLHVRATRTR